MRPAIPFYITPVLLTMLLDMQYATSKITPPSPLPINDDVGAIPAKILEKHKYLEL